MTAFRLRGAFLASALGLSLALSACASPDIVPAEDQPTTGVEVAGEGTVIQLGDAAPMLCLGAVAESYPPQCSGPELVGWDWESVEGEESSSGTTWGTYAITGTWDGTTLTVGSAIMLALYDPMPIPDPALDPANAGATPDDELLAIQSTVAEEAPVEVLMSWPENGYLFVRVLFDDGAVQTWATQRYGPDVVQVRPALRILE